jgi:hypothetical protein
MPALSTAMRANAEERVAWSACDDQSEGLCGKTTCDFDEPIPSFIFIENYFDDIHAKR